MVEKNIGESLRNERKRRGLTQSQVADILKISTDYVSKIEMSKKDPSDIVMKGIVEFLADTVEGRAALTPAEQVLTQPKGTSKVNKSVSVKYRNETTKEPQLSDFTLIPYYNVEASAGGGAVVQEEKIVDRFAFKEDWIRHGLGLNPNNLALISTIGDSMEPTLHPGDMILLDRSVEKIQSNSIYAIQVNGTLLVKRIQKRIDGSVVIKSDNAAYETETISSDAADALKIVGRVVWAGRRF